MEYRTHRHQGAMPRAFILPALPVEGLETFINHLKQAQRAVANFSADGYPFSRQWMLINETLQSLTHYQALCSIETVPGFTGNIHVYCIINDFSDR